MSRRHIDLPARTLPAWLVPIACLAAAQVAMRGSGIQSDGLALPSQVATALFALIVDGEIFLRTAETISAIGVGVPIGGALGLLLGVWLGLSPRAASSRPCRSNCFVPFRPLRSFHSPC